MNSAHIIKLIRQGGEISLCEAKELYNDGIALKNGKISFSGPRAEEAKKSYEAGLAWRESIAK